MDEEGFGVVLFGDLSHPWPFVLMGTQVIRRGWGDRQTAGVFPGTSAGCGRCWDPLPEPCLRSTGAQAWPSPARPELASLPEPPLPRPQDRAVINQRQKQKQTEKCNQLGKGRAG